MQEEPYTYQRPLTLTPEVGVLKKPLVEERCPFVLAPCDLSMLKAKQGETTTMLGSYWERSGR